MVRFIASVLALFLTSRLPLGLRIDGFWSLGLAALVLGLANAFLRPLLLFLTLPLTVLSFGLFVLVINALILLLVAAVVPGVHVAGFGGAFLSGIVLGIATFGFTLLLEGLLAVL